MRPNFSLATAVVLLLMYAPSGTMAFFEQFFHGSHQQAQQPAPFSFQAHYDNGTFVEQNIALLSWKKSRKAHWVFVHFVSPAKCADYLCPETLECVASRAQCTCPLSTDVKCVIPGGGIGGAGGTAARHEVAYVCARDCKQVKVAARAI